MGTFAAGPDRFGNEVSGPNASVETFKAVSAGDGHTCGLTTAGRLRCWGADYFTQVSGPNGSTDSFTAVNAGDHTCAVRIDGRLRCWGLPETVFGPNSSTDSFTSVSVATGAENIGLICAVKSDGHLQMLGLRPLLRKRSRYGSQRQQRELPRRDCRDRSGR